VTLFYTLLQALASNSFLTKDQESCFTCRLDGLHGTNRATSCEQGKCLGRRARYQMVNQVKGVHVPLLQGAL